jgi:hypothetical protein
MGGNGYLTQLAIAVDGGTVMLQAALATRQLGR